MPSGDRCESTFTFPRMETVFECQNRPDTLSPHSRPGQPAWSHRHGRWHHYEDEQGGQRFRIEWEDADVDE